VPIFHSPLPENVPDHYGEFLLGQTMKEINNDLLEIWFNLNYLPGVPDIDLIIFEPNRGLYTAEVKSLEIESIEQYDLENLIVKGKSDKSQHPVKQARVGQIKLRNYLNEYHLKANRIVKPPFIQTTIIWNKISRDQWNKKFSNPQIKIQAQAMLFADDLVSNESLMRALKSLWEYPLLGTVAPPHTRKLHEGVSEFRIAIEGSKLDKKYISEQKQELSKISKTSKNLAENYVAGRQHFVLLEGAPGTGKTTVLREIGLMHSAAGGAVLHICFSKVLAADQKYEYQILKTNKPVYGFIDVFDEWRFYKEYVGPLPGLPPKSEIKERFIDFISNKTENEKIYYDTILIDEAQDLDSEIFEMIEMVARPSASWFISYGKGQEIFGFKDKKEHPSQWLQNFFKKAERKLLKRSFRNSTRAFLLGQSFWENFPDSDKAIVWFAERFLKDINTVNQLEFELNLPTSNNDFSVITLEQNKGYKLSIKSLLIEQIESSKLANKGSDLLLVVSSPSNKEEKEEYSSYKIVLECLQELASEIRIDFQDLIPRDDRRNVPVSGSVRIVSHQNVRGLSASHVVVFDVNHLESWCKDITKGEKGPLINYGYICFSRSKASTTIAKNPDSDSDLVSYMSKLIDAAKLTSIKSLEQN
jgi:hypothetical protein